MRPQNASLKSKGAISLDFGPMDYISSDVKSIILLDLVERSKLVLLTVDMADRRRRASTLSIDKRRWMTIPG